MAAPREMRNVWKGLAFLSPWLIGFSIFTLLPVLMSAYLSLCDYSGMQPPLFRGFENYRLLFHDPVFWKAIRNTFMFAAMSLPAGMFIALFTAVLLNARIKGQGIYRTIIFLPSIVPAVGSAMIWLILLNARIGLINYFLRRIGVADPPAWIADASWALPSLAIMSIWSVGNTVIIYLAGLQDVPRDLYEASDLDGAGPIAQFLHVTLPWISPVIFFNLIMGIIESLQVFVQPYIVTQGGPARATYFYTQFIYDNMFNYFKMGMASALAWMQLIMILILTGLAFWSSRHWVHYQED